MFEELLPSADDNGKYAGVGEEAIEAGIGEGIEGIGRDIFFLSRALSELK